MLKLERQKKKLVYILIYIDNQRHNFESKLTNQSKNLNIIDNKYAKCHEELKKCKDELKEIREIQSNI